MTEPSHVVPHGIIVNCASGRVMHAPLTAEQVAARQAEAARHVAARQAETEARQQLVATVAASVDPAVQALAKLLGVLPLRGPAS